MYTLKTIIILFYAVLQGNFFYAMDELKPKASPYSKLVLYKSANNGVEITIKNLLSSFIFDFGSLSNAYLGALRRAVKLMPNEKIRSCPYMQEAIEKIRAGRKIAIDKLPIAKKYSVDQTLLEQGKLYFSCAQIVYPYLEPYISHNHNANKLFFYIAKIGNVQILQNFVIQYEQLIDWNYVDDSGRTVLHVLVILAQENDLNDNLDMMNYLMSHNVDCNKQDYYIEVKKDVDIKKETDDKKDTNDKSDADRKSDIDGKNDTNDKICDKPVKYNNKTPLHYAVENRNRELIEILLKNKANPNIVDYFKKSALHYVAPGPDGHQKIFEMLLKAGANIDSKDDEGKTLLFRAVKKNNPQEVSYLLSLGANPLAMVDDDPESTVSDKCLMPYELAVMASDDYTKKKDKKKNSEIIRLLQEAISF